MNKRQKKKREKKLAGKQETTLQKKVNEPKEQKKEIQHIVEIADSGILENEVIVIKEVGKKKKKEWNPKFIKLLSFIWIPVSLLFLELIMGFSTGGKLLSHHGLYIIAFSISYGLILYFLTNITKWKILNVVLQGTVLLLASFLHTIIYLLFCEFRVFYDLNTMMAGAGDAISDFTGDIIAIIATPNGASHVILFFLPFILYLVIGRKCTLKRAHHQLV